MEYAVGIIVVGAELFLKVAEESTIPLLICALDILAYAELVHQNDVIFGQLIKLDHLEASNTTSTTFCETCKCSTLSLKTDLEQ